MAKISKPKKIKVWYCILVIDRRSKKATRSIFEDYNNGNSNTVFTLRQAKALASKWSKAFPNVEYRVIQLINASATYKS